MRTKRTLTCVAQGGNPPEFCILLVDNRCITGSELLSCLRAITAHAKAMDWVDSLGSEQGLDHFERLVELLTTDVSDSPNPLTISFREEILSD